MSKMNNISYLEEAETCRRRAMAYVGKPEATFLLRAAEEFERLDAEKRTFQVRPRRADR